MDDFKISDESEKTCSRCGFSGNATMFPKNGKVCKLCRKATSAAYNKENSLSILKRRKKYRDENKEIIKKRAAIYRQEKKESIKEYQQKYSKENSEYINKRRRNHRKKIKKENSDLIKATASRWYSKNKERLKMYKEENKEKINEKSRYNSSIITNGYVAKRLKIRVGDIPDELFELKREQLQLMRALREAKNGIA